MKKKIVTGILLGNAPKEEEARHIAEIYNNCPYCVSYVNSGCTIIGVFSLPEDHKWWLEWVVSNPEETLGLENAEAFTTMRIKTKSPWSLGEIKPILDKAPCGAECSECFRYQKECKGCPATSYYIYD